MEKDIPCKQKSKESYVALLTSDKIVFKTKTIIRKEEGHDIKGSIQQEDKTFVNIFAMHTI